MYHKANEKALGVKVRRFRQWFAQEKDDQVKIEQLKPQTKPQRVQNKVIPQGLGKRVRFSQKDKLSFTGKHF